MEFLILWLFIVLVGAELGKKRRGRLDGAIWALFLGPIGWLIVLCFARREQCPDCGSLLVKGFKKCSKCGGISQSK
jgi:hypothetical protein